MDWKSYSDVFVAYKKLASKLVTYVSYAERLEELNKLKETLVMI